METDRRVIRITALGAGLSPDPAAEWTEGLQNSDGLGDRFEKDDDSPFVETCGQPKRRGRETTAFNIFVGHHAGVEKPNCGFVWCCVE